MDVSKPDLPRGEPVEPAGAMAAPARSEWPEVGSNLRRWLYAEGEPRWSLSELHLRRRADDA